MSSNSDALEGLMGVIDALLGPGGCPWDQQQTPLTLCDYVIEEAFELVEAIRAQDVQETREELGDVTFLLLFIAALHKNRPDGFSFADALETNAAKMIRRHPHVFGDTMVESQAEVLRNWEKIKSGERAHKEESKASLYASLPNGLPPLLKAYRIHSKAARTGFTWPDDQAARRQFDDEWREWEEAMAGEDRDHEEEEFGDLLFTLVELGRRRGIKANAALDRANRKFLQRFEAMELKAREQGLAIREENLDALNALWEGVKADKA